MQRSRSVWTSVLSSLLLSILNLIQHQQSHQSHCGVLTAAEMKHSHPVLILKLRHVTQCERCSMRFYSFGLTFVCFSGRQKIQLEKETSEETLTCAEKPAARRGPQTDGLNQNQISLDLTHESHQGAQPS